MQTAQNPKMMGPRLSWPAGPFLTWFWLSLPGTLWVWGFFDGGGAQLAKDAINPTGALSAFLMIFALAATPWQRLLRGRWGGVWLVRNRRYLGVASFAYAALHTLFYVAAKGGLDPLLSDLPKIYIWTGWVSFLLLVPLALTSNNASVRRLRKRWKPLQRLVYAAAIIGLLHIVSLHDWENPWEPLLIASPLIALELWRLRSNRKQGKKRPAQGDTGPSAA